MNEGMPDVWGSVGNFFSLSVLQSDMVKDICPSENYKIYL